VSGANAARDGLRKVMTAVYAPVYAAGGSFASAYLAAKEADDLVEALQQTVLLAVAAEHLREMAADAEKSVRAILAETMDSTGAAKIQTDTLTAYLSRKPTWVSVDQESMLPPEYMHQPPPTPDKKKIKAAIEAGEDVPGCNLVRPNDSTLVIRSKKD
jgi:hypothetical protein